MWQHSVEELTEVICSVLETSLFAIGVPCAREELPSDVAQCLYGQIRFEGPAKGRLEVAVPRDAWRGLAADLLACEPDDVQDAQLLDVIKELLNVTCSQWLTTTYGDAPLFAVSIPLGRVDGRASWDRLRAAPESLGFFVDAHALLAALSLETGAAP